MPGLDSVEDVSEIEDRRRRLARELERRKLDALIISTGPNVRYLTGFTGSNAALLVSSAAEAFLFTDPRYQLQVAQEATCNFRVARGPLLPPLMALACRKRLLRLGFEKGRLTFAEFELLEENLFLEASLQPVAGLVERQRMIKSASEICLMRRSARTNSKAFTRAMRKARPGVTEAELAAELDYQMRLLGAHKPAFDTIVAFGARTAFPHAQPAANRLATNQLLLIDMGASQDGYASDMTRMAFLGTPGGKVRRLYGAVLEAQRVAIEAVRPGVPASQVDAAARRVLSARGLEKAFIHSSGHGLGLEVHEPPRLGRRDKTRLAAGMVLTIEPGAYLDGFGGVRIEDTAVVTPTGCEILTLTPKELLVL